MCALACRGNAYLLIQQRTSKFWWCYGQNSSYVAGYDTLVINTKLLILINLSHLFSLCSYPITFWMHIWACEGPHKHLLSPKSKDRRDRHTHRTEGWDPCILFHDWCALRCVTGKDGRVQIARAIHPFEGEMLAVQCHECLQRRHHTPLLLEPTVLGGQSWALPLVNQKCSSSPYSILTCREPHLLQKGSAAG